MKRAVLLVTLALGMVLVGASCDELITDLTTPNVTYSAISGGTQLRLTWAPVADAQGYKVQTDDSTFTTTATTFDVTSPTKTISVFAYSGASESNKWTLNTTAVVTTTLDVWGNSDPSPDHPSAFGFTAEGAAVAYALANAADYPKLDFVMDDIAQGSMYFYSPNRYNPVFNDKDNAVATASGTDFDAATLATGDFFTALSCVEGGLYYFWLDPNANGWDASDHFGKIKVVSMSGAKVTLKLAYQKVPGLVWVKTN
ncbi:MAG: hypothetical protein R6X12_03435 [bacterium]